MRRARRTGRGAMKGTKKPHGPLWDRFWAKVDMSGGEDACWPWKGAKSKKRGTSRRGHIREAGRGSRMRLAHVVALALVGDGSFEQYDPDSGVRLQACHSCHARWGDCCNPKHLYWGSKADNEADRRLAEIRKAIGADQVSEAARV